MSELLAPVQVEIASYPKKSPPRHKINDKLMYLYHRETTFVNNSLKNISITAWSKKLGRIKDTKIRPSPAGIYEDTRQTAVLAFHPIVQIVISLAPPHRGLFTYSTKSCIPAKACLQKKKRTQHQNSGDQNMQYWHNEVEKTAPGPSVQGVYYLIGTNLINQVLHKLYFCRFLISRVKESIHIVF